MAANAAIFIIVNKFPKNGKIFTILKSLVEAAELDIITLSACQKSKREAELY